MGVVLAYEVQSNIGAFQVMFGNFFVIDNSEGSDFNTQINNVYKKILVWSKKTPNNSAVSSWIKTQKNSVNEEIYEEKDSGIKTGDTVRIKKQFADSPAEAKMLYVVKELRTPRVLIAPKVWKSGIAPTESLQLSQIEKV